MPAFEVTRVPGGASPALRRARPRCVSVAPSAWRTITAAVSDDEGQEVCGALFGRVTSSSIAVVDAVPARNVAADPRHRYEIAAPDVRALDRQARAAGLEVVGYYHSHPDGEAAPSPVDLELALPGVVYLIVSGAGVGRVWRLEEDRSAFREEELRIE